jgi:hypothetical protein
MKRTRIADFDGSVFGEAPMAARKTEKVNVWLTPEQVAWLKAKENLSETVRAMVTEAMNLDRLKASLKTGKSKKRK